MNVLYKNIEAGAVGIPIGEDSRIIPLSNGHDFYVLSHPQTKEPVYFRCYLAGMMCGVAEVGPDTWCLPVRMSPPGDARQVDLSIEFTLQQGQITPRESLGWRIPNEFSGDLYYDNEGRTSNPSASLFHILGTQAQVVHLFEHNPKLYDLIGK